ncbi:hypothetical protein ACO2Q9_03855 [Variovorax sp. VNK109]|uniref:hypothetical protein n=1 Tax=Variovorax sp. VNK109 TaxID=3400919 RepID=UPI003C0B16EB
MEDDDQGGFGCGEYSRFHCENCGSEEGEEKYDGGTEYTACAQCGWFDREALGY